ncbi:MAG TPA: trigger factor [Solirubrobacteraceae bacterium]|nr:trigger factor [Solirubrobacteraceae bacterium]
MAVIETTVTELPESRVRVEAQVPAAEVDKRVQRAARALGREMRIPGFRRGKVPPPLVIRRVGRQAILDEAVRDGLSSWYVDAIEAAGVDPVGDPSLDLQGLPPEGEPLRFSIEIGVRPTARLGEYRGLEVGRREPEVSEEAIQGEVDQLRERLAKLESVEEPAGRGDFVVVDFVGSIDGEPFAGGEARDEMIELGSGRLVEGFEAQLQGARAGEERTVAVTFPEDYRATDLAGRAAEFAVTVKDVKRKELPELDDDFASDAAGFDSLEELREDVRTRLAEREDQAIEGEFREAVVDAAVAGATVDVPDALVEARAREVWEQTAHSLSHQGISKEVYLQISGKTEDEVVEQAKPDAEVALRREAVLAAVIEAEGIDPADGDLLEALGPSAERESTTPEKLLERLRSSGRASALKRDVAQRQAVDLLEEHATAISVEQAKARDKLWTPGQEETASGGQIWTPGS